MPESTLLELKPLDVCLLNGRTYIQGTQMIARTIEILTPNEASFIGTKFTRLTDRQVLAGLCDEAPQSANCIGSLSFEWLSKTRVAVLFEGPRPAPARGSAVDRRLPHNSPQIAQRERHLRGVTHPGKPLFWLYQVSAIDRPGEDR